MTQHAAHAPLTPLTTQHRLNAALPLTLISTHYSALTTQHSALHKGRMADNNLGENL
ncbi:hypothetical protein H6G36_09430 [Anabaena minutissima FACHB-250]|nr:hypothetical protein [Anabaena minutissima FACHB-250]